MSKLTYSDYQERLNLHTRTVEAINNQRVITLREEVASSIGKLLDENLENLSFFQRDIISSENVNDTALVIAFINLSKSLLHDYQYALETGLDLLEGETPTPNLTSQVELLKKLDIIKQMLELLATEI